LPTLGSLPAIARGAFIGGDIGAPLGPFGVAGGAIVGGVAGGFLGSAAISTAQDWVLSKLPDTWREKIGMDDRQRQLDEEHHPVASYLGGIAPYALTMRPGIAARDALPPNATALQRITSSPYTKHIFAGAVVGGIEL
jgi:hypothetical protein